MPGAYVSQNIATYSSPTETYDVPNASPEAAPPPTVDGEYVEVSDVQEHATTIHSQAAVLPTSARNSVPEVLDDKENGYDYVMQSILLPLSSYQYVPTLVSSSSTVHPLMFMYNSILSPTAR